MRVLFIITNEVSRRSIQPIFDQLLSLGVEVKLLLTHFTRLRMDCDPSCIVDIQKAKILSWDFIVSANPIKKDDFKGRRVCAHHGSMFGNNSWSLQLAVHSDLYFGLSPYELVYIKKHIQEFDENKFIASGNPANDRLYQYRHATLDQKAQWRTEMGIKDQATLLLTSHWTSMGNLRHFGIGLLDALAWNFPGHQIICTCHPSLLSNPRTEYRIHKSVATPYFHSDWLLKSLKQQSRLHDRVHIITEVEPAKLLAVSDVFIGDNSSFLAEAAYFDLPLFARIEGSYFDPAILKIVKSSIQLFDDIETLVGQVAEIDQNSLTPVKRGESIKKLFMHNVGASAQSVVDRLIAM